MAGKRTVRPLERQKVSRSTDSGPFSFMFCLAKAGLLMNRLGVITVSFLPGSPTARFRRGAPMPSLVRAMVARPAVGASDARCGVIPSTRIATAIEEGPGE